MVRVIYRWSEPPGRKTEFADWWHRGTLRIRSDFAGALGSTLLAPVEDQGELAAIQQLAGRGQPDPVPGPDAHPPRLSPLS